MKNIPYKGYRGIRMPKEIQAKRIQQVIAEELTAHQREVLIAYYVQGRNTTQIAWERGVHRSTVCRTLRRAEDKLRKFLKY